MSWDLAVVPLVNSLKALQMHWIICGGGRSLLLTNSVGVLSVLEFVVCHLTSKQCAAHS